MINKRNIIPALFLPLIQSYRYRGEANFYEKNVPPYSIPDVFLCKDESYVESRDDWESMRRIELLQVFQKEVYGVTLLNKVAVRYELLEKDNSALDGRATRLQVRFILSGNNHSLEALLLVYLPNNGKSKHPVFMGYNFYGNQSTTDDEKVLYSPSTLEVWHNISKFKRGFANNHWCYDKAINQGYAVATMCYTDICPDSPFFKMSGAYNLFDSNDSESNWQAIGLWSWGCSRICDYLIGQSWVNRNQIAILGHSRLGKVALWAGAQDTRFAVVISNDSGCGGASLAKRYFGENISMITSNNPHWFCKNYEKYANKECNMLFDQHELLSLIAPRHLYVCSASKDLPADPKGEFLALANAGKVWNLYNLQGLPSEEFPSFNKPLMGVNGYHVRRGLHGVTPYDWDCWIKFCNMCYFINQ